MGVLRHSGFGFALDEGAPTDLVVFMGEQIGVPVTAFERYASRPATASDHAREAEAASGLRPPVNDDLQSLIEAATQAAWATDRGLPIIAGITDALCASCITLPAPSVIERAGLAGRTRARTSFWPTPRLSGGDILRSRETSSGTAPPLWRQGGGRSTSGDRCLAAWPPADVRHKFTLRLAQFR